jgi:hypothetical protein
MINKVHPEVPQGLGTCGAGIIKRASKTWYRTRFINRTAITNNNCSPNIRREFLIIILLSFYA